MRLQILLLYCITNAFYKNVNGAVTLDFIEESCLNEHGYDKNTILYDNNLIKEDDAKLNTFFSCVWKKKYLLRNDGTINFEKVFELLTPELKLTMGDFGSSYVVIESINACKDIEDIYYSNMAFKGLQWKKEHLTSLSEELENHPCL
ncbi:hypothetical protein FQA39_LY04239 [Lamprigera yunnana]|nr:hypothetical protein FQA39_LY04239 [Lamprigera yunnana]